MIRAAVASALAAILLPTVPAIGGGEPAPEDPRQREILRFECRSELGRRDVTLFGNGTVRLREGHWDDQTLQLDELTPGELDKILAALASVDTTALPPAPSVEGRWSQACEVRLDLPGRRPWGLRYAEWSIPPVAVSRVVQVAEDLALGTESTGRPDALPRGYEPRAGDVLRGRDGGVWRIIRFTADRRGLELESETQPVRIYVDLEALDDTFDRLVRRDVR